MDDLTGVNPFWGLLPPPYSAIRLTGRRQEDGQVTSTDLGQRKQALQVHCRSQPEPLQAAFGFSDIACLAQAMRHQFGLLAFDAWPQAIELFELVGLLALACGSQVRFVERGSHRASGGLAVNAASEQRAGLANLALKGEGAGSAPIELCLQNWQATSDRFAGNPSRFAVTAWCNLTLTLTISYTN